MKKTLGQQIVDEARSWRGTRWQHQGRVKGLGVDCVGFIAEVAKNVGLTVDIPNDYRRSENGEVMVQLLRKYGRIVKKMQPGDVLALVDDALREPNKPSHLAIVTEVLPHTTFIIEAGREKVVEHRMDGHWNDRIHSIWRMRK
jgi:cell wall-associated NlpC family hydrolase